MLAMHYRIFIYALRLLNKTHCAVEERAETKSRNLASWCIDRCEILPFHLLFFFIKNLIHIWPSENLTETTKYYTTFFVLQKFLSIPVFPPSLSSPKYIPSLSPYSIYINTTCLSPVTFAWIPPNLLTLLKSFLHEETRAVFQKCKLCRLTPLRVVWVKLRIMSVLLLRTQ